MEVFPDMDIHFPENKEAELLGEMRSRADDPWTWQPHDPFRRPAQDGHVYFHRISADGIPSCTVCLYRKRNGQLRVGNIVPDEQVQVTLPQCERVLKEFRSRIASPAARLLDGKTQFGSGHHSLENYFSKKASHLLESFCLGANWGDLGTHHCDQARWMQFLVYVRQHYRNPPHCDIFGKCLKEKNWWPECGIDRLVHEYDFAMRLLAIG